MVDKNTVLNRRLDWEKVAARLRDSTCDVTSREVTEWCYQQARLADERAAECRSIFNLWDAD